MQKDECKIQPDFALQFAPKYLSFGINECLHETRKVPIINAMVLSRVWELVDVNDRNCMFCVVVLDLTAMFLP